MSSNDPTITNSSDDKLKNKEFSTIIHTMRHDIRNYIAAIEGYAYLLKDEYNEEYLQRIFNNITNINDLVDRSVLLTDSDLDIEKFSDIDLNIILKTCQELVPETIKFQFNNLPKVRGDYQKILLVFNSIIENAIIHGSPGFIEIQGHKLEDGTYLVQILNDGNKIPKEIAETLFCKMPQSLKPKSGLSLIICRKIVHAHKWQLRLNDKIADRTCFEIVIPESSLSQ